MALVRGDDGEAQKFVLSELKLATTVNDQTLLCGELLRALAVWPCGQNSG